MTFVCSKCKIPLIETNSIYKCQVCKMVILNNEIYNALDKGKIIYLDNFNSLTENNEDFTKLNPYLSVVVNTINDHIKGYYENANFNNIKKFVEIIINSRYVYVFGAGRSGLMGQLFVEYLAKLDINAFIYGDVTSPYPSDKDCFIGLSGSGETNTTLTNMNIVKEKGLKILSLTSHINSSIYKLSDIVLIVDGDDKRKKKVNEIYAERILSGDYIKITPLGTLFELTLLAVLYIIGMEVDLILNKETKMLDLLNKRTLFEGADYNQLIEKTEDYNIFCGKILNISKNMINIKLDNGMSIHAADAEFLEKYSFLKKYNFIKDDFKNFMVVVKIEPKNIIFSNQILASSLQNQLRGKVVNIIKEALNSYIFVKIGSHKISGLLTNDSVDKLGIKLGKQIYIDFKAINVEILDIL